MAPARMRTEPALHRYRTAAALDPFRRAAVIGPPRVAVALALDGVIVLALAGLALARYGPPGVLGYLAIGLGVGVATCIPIGVANIIVIDAACRHGARRALGAGLGGAVADGVYASLGIFGIGPLLDRYPSLPQVLYAISGCVLLGYGAVLLRARPLLVGPGEPRAEPRRDHELTRGFTIGIVATLLNPAALVTWIVIVGAHATGLTRAEAAAWVAGIVVGAFAWFVVVVILTRRGRRVLRGRAVVLTRIIAVAMIAAGLLSFARVLGHL